MILILGYGFIGKALYRHLTCVGKKVRVFANNVEHSPESGFFRGDFSGIENIKELFDEVDTVIHLIHTTVPSSSADNPLYDLESNVPPTLNLLDNMMKCGVRKLIYFSSGGAVYGIPEKEQVDESHPANPVSPYGVSKLAIEKYLEAYSEQRDANVIILRPSNVYGFYENLHQSQGVVGHIVKHLLAGTELEVWGEGRGKKDYLYLDDLAEAVYKIMDAPWSAGCSVYNVASGFSYSVRELIEIAERISGKKMNVRFSEKKSFDVESIRLDSRRFRKQFGWTAQTTIEQGIARSLLEAGLKGIGNE